MLRVVSTRETHTPRSGMGHLSKSLWPWYKSQESGYTESNRVSGCFSATANSFSAASLGLRVPCSQACTVLVLTLSKRANMDCEQLSRWRSRTMFALDLDFGGGGATSFFSFHSPCSPRA